ncbi:phage tail family protein [Aquibacillus kalidii]|uniref:phage tail family protein n=1 Tax=Aquibacillus kalidii TaxID=2762597 RepID=UPI0016493579|nr:phage tail family protein [Aquibacillus kalidii]
MNLSNFKVIKFDGTEIDMQQAGIIIESFNISSPSPNTTTETIPNRDGFLDFGTTYEGREIDITGGFISLDGYDFRLFRNEVFKIFDSRQYFYIINDAEPSKRWKVKYNSPYPINRTALVGKFEITLISSSSYAESIGTTQDPLIFDSGLWQFGQGLSTENPTYLHTTSNFRIFNAGDKEIDPNELPLKITYQGASSNLTIKNLTTNDLWTYYGTSESWETIHLDGVKADKDGLSIFADTNYEVITIIPGWNDFEITGNIGDFQIDFDFRFYYL